MKNQRTFSFGLVAGCALMLILSGIGWASADKPLVGISMRSLENPFLVTVKDGVQKAIESAGGRVLIHDSRSDIGRQIQAFEEFVSQGADAIMFQAFDRVAIIPSVEAARKAGIAVITVDSTLSDADISGSVTSDNVMAGRLCGEYLIERLAKGKGGKPSGNVVIIEGKPSVTVLNRLRGFRDAVMPHRENVRIVATGNSGGNMTAAIEVMEKLLKAQKRIDGVFAINDPSAAGALTAIRAAEREKEMFLVSVDGSKTALEAIKRGSAWAFTAAQDPFAVGKTAAGMALGILKGEKPPERDILVPVSPVSMENVDKYLRNAKF